MTTRKQNLYNINNAQERAEGASPPVCMTTVFSERLQLRQRGDGRTLQASSVELPNRF